MRRLLIAAAVANLAAPIFLHALDISRQRSLAFAPGWGRTFGGALIHN